MAVDIDVITGFLESGKTTFLTNMIESGILADYEGMALLLCEEGEIEYKEEFLQKHNITLVSVDTPQSLTGGFLEELSRERNLDYILVEYNGTWDIQELLDIRLQGGCHFRNIVYIGEAGKFNTYYSNMAVILTPHMKNSDYVIINRYEEITNAEKKVMVNKIKGINAGSKPVFLNNPAEKKKILRIFTPYEDMKMTVTPGMVILMLALLLLCFLPSDALKNFYNYAQKISVSFLSILIQAIPFILLGSVLSSFLQLVIPVSWITRQLAQNNWKSFIAASLAGVCFPVCDCGLAPLVSGMLKKNIPLPQVITFWLASASVNPVVILSVFYAFPDHRFLAVVRILSGIFIAILTGIILILLDIRTKDVVRKDAAINFAGGEIIYENSMTRKAAVIIKGAQLEFFRVLKYVIIGALVSSICLTFIPQTIKLFLNDNALAQFGIMVVAAIFMSTCSTSNAFIGRSFYGQFTLPAVHSFMVLGPMLDFKNIIILSEVLTKKFLFQLCLLTVAAGFLAYTLFMFLLGVAI